MATFKYGILGCGMMGGEHIRNIALLADAEVVAIYEPNPDMAVAAKALAPGHPIRAQAERILSR